MEEFRVQRLRRFKSSRVPVQLWNCGTVEQPFQGFRVSEFQGFGTTVEPWNCGTVKQPFQGFRVSEFWYNCGTLEL